MATNNVINSPLPTTVANGGTGDVSFTTYMPVCGGTTTTGALQSISISGAASGYVLTYVSSSALPTWQAASGGLPTITTHYQLLNTTTGTAAWYSNYYDDSTNHNLFVGTATGNTTLSNTQNTGFGSSAISSLTNGPQNTAVGYLSGHAWTTGGQNTAIGAGAMAAGVSPSQCVAIGFNALNQEGSATYNTAVGVTALAASNGSNKCTAIGGAALNNLSTGNFNTMCGFQAGLSITTGTSNTGLGYQAFSSALTSSSNNTSVGALAGSTRSSYTNCTFLGYGADTNANGLTNAMAIGYNAVATASNQTVIGNGSTTSTVITGIYGATVGGTNSAVLIDNTNVLGTTSSSIKVKQNVTDMLDRSNKIYKLRPVNFSYKKDPTNYMQWGLIAEEVAEIMPEIVNYDDENKPINIRYHDLPVILLNELKKLREEVNQLKN